MEQTEFLKKLEVGISQYQKLLKLELKNRWESLQLNPSKISENEVIAGLLARQCSLVYQISFTPMSWNETFSPIIMRSMVENHINLSWILLNPSERSKMYIDYGLSNETKQLESLKSSSDQNEEKKRFIEYLENWINEQRFIHLNKINIGSWNFSNIRKTAIDSGNKDFYDLFYSTCSSATHSMWDYIAKHNLKKCENPLHKGHKIPKIKEPEIEIGMFLILTKIMNETFIMVDSKLSLENKCDSSFEYIESYFNKN